jgi:hypothetical protein
MIVAKRLVCYCLRWRVMVEERLADDLVPVVMAYEG